METLILDVIATAGLNVALFGFTYATGVLIFLQAFSHGLIHLATEPVLLSRGQMPTESKWAMAGYFIVNILKFVMFSAVLFFSNQILFGLQIDILATFTAWLAIYALYRLFRPTPNIPGKRWAEGLEFAGALLFRNVMLCVLFGDMLRPAITDLAKIITPLATKVMQPLYIAAVYLMLAASTIVSTVIYLLYRKGTDAEDQTRTDTTTASKVTSSMLNNKRAKHTAKKQEEPEEEVNPFKRKAPVDDDATKHVQP